MDDCRAHDHSGGCLCEAVRYRVRGPLRDVVNCHCGRCRRAHGHIGAYTEAPSRDLVLIEDRGLRWYVADQRERGFCRECGSSLFWRRTGSESISIAAGTLDEPTGLSTAAHIYVASGGDYYEICDALPRHAAGAPSDFDPRRVLLRPGPGGHVGGAQHRLATESLIPAQDEGSDPGRGDQR